MAGREEHSGHGHYCLPPFDRRDRRGEFPAPGLEGLSHGDSTSGTGLANSIEQVTASHSLYLGFVCEMEILLTPPARTFRSEWKMCGKKHWSGIIERGILIYS